MKCLLVFLFLFGTLLHAQRVATDDCRLSRSEIINFNAATLEAKLDWAATVTRRDSSTSRRFSIPISKLVSDRRTRVIRTTFHHNWKRASRHLWVSAEDTREIAASFGFVNPYYFSYFLAEYAEENSCREELLARMRENIFRVNRDSSVYQLNDKELVFRSFRFQVANDPDNPHRKH